MKICISASTLLHSETKLTWENARLQFEGLHSIRMFEWTRQVQWPHVLFMYSFLRVLGDDMLYHLVPFSIWETTSKDIKARHAAATMLMGKKDTWTPFMEFLATSVWHQEGAKSSNHPTYSSWLNQNWRLDIHSCIPILTLSYAPMEPPATPENDNNFEKALQTNNETMMLQQAMKTYENTQKPAMDW